jgi:hypothetical protein
MIDDNKSKIDVDDGRNRGFLASLLVGLVRDAVKLIIAFAIGTGVGAIVCLYYGIPLVFSLLGGILVLGLALVFSTDSLFS